MIVHDLPEVRCGKQVRTGQRTSSLTEPPGWSWQDSQQGLEGGVGPGGLLGGGPGVGAWTPRPQLHPSSWQPLWRIVPVASEGWHQLVECVWGSDSVFGFKA